MAIERARSWSLGKVCVGLDSSALKHENARVISMGLTTRKDDNKVMRKHWIKTMVTMSEKHQQCCDDDQDHGDDE